MDLSRLLTALSYSGVLTPGTESTQSSQLAGGGNLMSRSGTSPVNRTGLNFSFNRVALFVLNLSLIGRCLPSEWPTCKSEFMTLQSPEHGSSLIVNNNFEPLSRAEHGSNSTQVTVHRKVAISGFVFPLGQRLPTKQNALTAAYVGWVGRGSMLMKYHVTAIRCRTKRKTVIKPHDRAMNGLYAVASLNKQTNTHRLKLS